MTVTAAAERIAEATRLLRTPEPNAVLPFDYPSTAPSSGHLQADRFYVLADLIAHALTPRAESPLDLTFGIVGPALTLFPHGGGTTILVDTWHPALSEGIRTWSGVSLTQSTAFSFRLDAAARAVEGSLPFDELTGGISAATLTTSPPPKGSKAFRAFTELRRWLGLTADDAADLVGVGRTTPNAWAREGREPRPASARRLYQLHSVVSALVHRFGEGGAIHWLETGEPSPRDLIVAGNLQEVTRAAERALIGDMPLVGPAPGSLIEETSAPMPIPFAPRVRRRTRRHLPQGE